MAEERALSLQLNTNWYKTSSNFIQLGWLHGYLADYVPWSKKELGPLTSPPSTPWQGLPHCLHSWILRASFKNAKGKATIIWGGIQCPWSSPADSNVHTCWEPCSMALWYFVFWASASFLAKSGQHGGDIRWRHLRCLTCSRRSLICFPSFVLLELFSLVTCSEMSPFG